MAEAFRKGRVLIAGGKRSEPYYDGGSSLYASSQMQLMSIPRLVGRD